MSTWTEDHAYAGQRSKLTTRAIAWAVDALRHDDTTVSAIARHLGVDWHTAWGAIGAEAKRRIKRPERLQGVKGTVALSVGIITAQEIFRSAVAPSAPAAVLSV